MRTLLAVLFVLVVATGCSAITGVEPPTCQPIVLDARDSLPPYHMAPIRPCR